MGVVAGSCLPWIPPRGFQQCLHSSIHVPESYQGDSGEDGDTDRSVGSWVAISHSGPNVDLQRTDTLKTFACRPRSCVTLSEGCLQKAPSQQTDPALEEGPADLTRAMASGKRYESLCG